MSDAKILKLRLALPTEKNPEIEPEVVRVARMFSELVRLCDSTWYQAFLRFSMANGEAEFKGSFLFEGGAWFIVTADFEKFFSGVAVSCAEMLVSKGMRQGVFLMTLTNDRRYVVEYDSKNMNRWDIKDTNLSGIPEGFFRNVSK